MKSQEVKKKPNPNTLRHETQAYAPREPIIEPPPLPPSPSPKRNKYTHVVIHHAKRNARAPSPPTETGDTDTSDCASKASLIPDASTTDPRRDTTVLATDVAGVMTGLAKWYNSACRVFTTTSSASSLSSSSVTRRVSSSDVSVSGRFGELARLRAGSSRGYVFLCGFRDVSGLGGFTASLGGEGIPVGAVFSVASALRSCARCLGATGCAR